MRREFDGARSFAPTYTVPMTQRVRSDLGMAGGGASEKLGNHIRRSVSDALGRGLVFDYRVFGASEGTQGSTSIGDQIEDYRNAILCRDPDGVDADRIVYWGFLPWWTLADRRVLDTRVNASFRRSRRRRRVNMERVHGADGFAASLRAAADVEPFRLGRVRLSTDVEPESSDRTRHVAVS